MLLPFVLFAAAQVAGPPQVPPPVRRPAAAGSAPFSKPQAEAALVATFNQLVEAMKQFSAHYKGSHTVDARKAQAVRKAWREFQTAQMRYNALIEMKNKKTF